MSGGGGRSWLGCCPGPAEDDIARQERALAKGVVDRGLCTILVWEGQDLVARALAAVRILRAVLEKDEVCLKSSMAETNDALTSTFSKSTLTLTLTFILLTFL